MKTPEIGLKKQRGKFRKAAVRFFNWKMKKGLEAAALFLLPNSTLTADGWRIKTKN
jgi:hypothetical protein